MSDSGTVVIHGKTYETVALRVRKFRDVCPDHTLSTEIVERTEDVVVMKATISDTSGRCVATGHAEEYRKASQINKTSALENAETSAIGRCLAAFGLGGTEFATADEVANAISRQKTSAKSVAKAEWNDLNIDVQTVLLDIEKDARKIASDEGWPATYHWLNTEHSDLDATEVAALWSRFSSEERRLMKERKAA